MHAWYSVERDQCRDVKDIMGTNWTSSYTSPITLITITPNWKLPSIWWTICELPETSVELLMIFHSILMCLCHQTRLPTYTNCNSGILSCFRYTMVIFPLLCYRGREHFRQGFLRNIEVILKFYMLNIPYSYWGW